jgi:DNA ligase (NAD+)
MNMDFDYIEKNTIQFVNSSSQEDIEKLLYQCSDNYYNTEDGNILISDQVFDTIKSFLELTFPDSKFLSQIGSTIKKGKVKLPIHMGSMNKKKTEKDIDKWIKTYPEEVLLSDKLDGISFLLNKKNGKIQILTRGNGKEGKDISKIQDFVNINKKKLNKKKDFMVRGEILVSKENYIKVKDEFANPRSFVAGLSNQKDFSKKEEYLKLIDFVVYELIEPIMKPSEQIDFLKELGFQVVRNEIRTNINFKDLSSHMLERKEKSKYDIDGLIITNNKINIRNIDGNPKYSFAFKMDLDFAITKVINVEWNVSKHGKLKPIVNIEPTLLCGTTNRKATGNNADFIIKNGIGPGAVIKMIKGGEIIPKIVEVLEKTEPQLPEVDYKWNDTHKEIILANMEEDTSVKIKRIITFFKTMEVENVGPGLFNKMYAGGFHTIKEIMNIRVEDLLELEGIKEKSANKIYDSINLIIKNPIEVEKVIAGSCIFGNGIGYKILKKITNKYPKIFYEDMDITIEMLNEIPSIQEKTSIKIIEKLPKIKEFLLEHNQLKFKKKKIVIKKDLHIENPKLLNNKNIVITGKRDKKILEKIELDGGVIQNTVNKKTNILIVETMESHSSKMLKAVELNIDILTNEMFMVKYC